MKTNGLIERMFPGLVPEDAYDDDYPEGVAGHVESGARIDPASDVVNTPFGIEHDYDGPRLDGTEHEHYVEGVGNRETDALVIKATRESKGDTPKQVRDAAETWNAQTVTLPNALPARLVIANPNRKTVTVYCVSGGPVSLGRERGIVLNGPNTVSLPVGGYRTFTHKDIINVVGPTGAVIDVCEENYPS